jgi:hypothetical protein
VNEITISPRTEQPIAAFLYAPIFTTDGLLRHATQVGCQEGPERGRVFEFGVGAGHSTRIIRSADKFAEVFGFDSFEGLPKDWYMGDKVWRAGAFGRLGMPPDIEGVTLVKGLFEETIPIFLHRRENIRAALVSIDCDLYESAKTVLSLMDDLIVVGTVIYFDEICDWGGAQDRYPNWPHGEYRAFCEWVHWSKSEVAVIGRNDRYGAAVRVLA